MPLKPDLSTGKILDQMSKAGFIDLDVKPLKVQLILQSGESHFAKFSSSQHREILEFAQDRGITLDQAIIEACELGVRTWRAQRAKED